MATLRIKFRGLMGFVPRYVDGKNGITILSPTVGGARLSNFSGEKDFLSRHYQFLEIGGEFIVQNSPRKADFYLKRDGIERGIFFTAGEELSISTGAPPSEFSEFYEPTAKDLKRPSLDVDPDLNNKQARDTKWLVGMEYAYPYAGSVDSDCLGDNLKGLISGRISMFEGVLQVSKLSKQTVTPDGKIDAPLFKFPLVPSLGEFEQALSEEIMLEIADAELVIIVSNRLSTGEAVDPIILQPKNDVIEFVVHNSELEDIAGPPDLLIGQPIDFELLYDLCGVNVPLNARRTPSSDDGTAGDRICPGGKFSMPESEKEAMASNEAHLANPGD
jgi:hypothetical protein